MNAGINCVVLACDPKAPALGESCARSAYFAWLFVSTRAKIAGPEAPLQSFARSLAVRRDRGQNGTSMILSRVQSDANGELNIVRSRPRSQVR